MSEVSTPENNPDVAPNTILEEKSSQETHLLRKTKKSSQETYLLPKSPTASQEEFICAVILNLIKNCLEGTKCIFLICNSYKFFYFYR